MKRREVIKRVGWSALAVQLGLLAGGCSESAPPAAGVPLDDVDAGAALRALADGLDGIDFIGPVCVDRVAVEAPLEQLMDRLAGRGKGEVGSAYAAQVADEHASGDVFDIDGWQIARSECLLVAGAAIQRGLSSPRRDEAGEFRKEDFLDVIAWGPDETLQGEVFNRLGNGRGSFWIRVNGSAPGSVRLMLAGQMLATHFEPGVVTGSLDPEASLRIVEQPGLYELEIVDTARGLAQSLGFLTVRERPPMAELDNGSLSEVFCRVERWGPDQANLGAAFNEQPDGSAAFWVRVGCAPDSARLELDGRPLPTAVRTGLVTARVPFYADLTTGDHALILFDPESGERISVGTFRVL
jgi:hypothetical protein